jgi:hypothetical protein
MVDSIEDERHVELPLELTMWKTVRNLPETLIGSKHFLQTYRRIENMEAHTSPVMVLLRISGKKNWTLFFLFIHFISFPIC